MISTVIMAYIGEDYSTVLEQAKLIAEDIIILTMDDAGYTITQYNSGRVFSASSSLKGYGELLSECIECAAGEYVLLLKSGDSIRPDSSLDIKEGCHAYYADIFDDRYEGTVQHREARVFSKNVSLKGRYQIDEMMDMGSCGLSIQSSSACEKSFLKEWIERELQDDYGWKEEYILAECCYILGQYNDACSHYKRIYSLREFRPSSDLYRDICWAFIAGDCYGDGRTVIEEAANEYPDFMESYYISAVIYREQGEDRRCISCLKKIFESTGREVHKELVGYKGIHSCQLMAEALYSVEEYISAAFYYRLCVLEKPKEKQYMISLCSSLQLSGLCQKEMEEYLQEELPMSSDDMYEAMVEHYMDLRQWDKVGEYARQLQGTRALEVQVESLYHMKSYSRCLLTISSSSHGE
jgi:tetratricopeptide (TPR) repeat protein